MNVSSAIRLGAVGRRATFTSRPERVRERKSPRLDDDRQPCIGDSRRVEGTASPAATPTPEAIAVKDARSVPRIGVLAWSFVGVVAATVIVVIAFGAVSEILLPLLFAAVLAVIFKPLVGKLERRGLKPTLAAGVIVLGLAALMTVVMVATVRGILQQTDEIGDSIDAALVNASAELDVDKESLDDARAAAEGTTPAIADGFVTKVVSGIDALVGLAGGLILGALIMYYLLKDGTRLRRSVVAQIAPSIRDEVDSFIGEACQILRSYGRGRTVMSAVVAAVIGIASLLLSLPLVFTIVVANFIGGYIPYIGAFLGGGLAVMIALGDGGLDVAAVMLLVVVASNLLLENFVEPRVMGRTLDIHPLLVLVVTALGGFLFGIVGLILAVPFTVIAGKALGRLRSRGFLTLVADRAEPTIQKMLN
jgi:putative heme transporter